DRRAIAAVVAQRKQRSDAAPATGRELHWLLHEPPSSAHPNRKRGPSSSFLSASDRDRSAPRIFALEGLIELEHPNEFLTAVGRLAHEQPEIDKGEDHVADVAARPDAPMLEHEPRHDAEPLEREVPAGQRELSPADVASLVEALLAILEGGEH